MDEYSIERARRALGEVVDRARYAGEPSMITRQGKPAAVVVSAEWYASARKALDGQASGGTTEGMQSP
jgi:prevent-host-death family protein